MRSFASDNNSGVHPLVMDRERVEINKRKKGIYEITNH